MVVVVGQCCAAVGGGGRSGDLFFIYLFGLFLLLFHVGSLVRLARGVYVAPSNKAVYRVVPTVLPHCGEAALGLVSFA